MTQVIVLGFHRSGTSMIAGILHKLGVHMGNDLIMGTTEHNPKGYYEDRDFVDLNERILTALESGWATEHNLDLIYDIIGRFEEPVKELIEARQQYPIWGWKDPRNSVTLPVYLHYLERPRLIVCQRYLEGATRSLVKREKERIKLDEAIDLYAYYNRAIIKYAAPTGYYVAYYEDLVENRDIEGLARYIGLKPEIEQVTAARGHIDPKLNRHPKFTYGGIIPKGMSLFPLRSTE